jgi:signal transduction histidine kinase
MPSPRHRHDSRAPSPPRRFHLQRFIIALSVALTALVLVACVALELLTTINQRHIRRTGEIRSAKSAALSVALDVQRFSWLSNYLMVTHDVNREPERSETMQRVFASLAELKSSVEPSELPKVEQIEAQVRSYISLRHQQDLLGIDPDHALLNITPVLDAVYRSVEDIVAVETDKLDHEQANVVRWDRLAGPIGSSIALLSVLGSVVGLSCLYRVGFRPLLLLTETVRRYTQGERDLRAAPHRSEELGEATDSFNQMADTIASEHRRMLEFVGDVALDLKEPMVIVQTSLGEVLRKPPPGIDDVTRQRLMTANRQLDRLAALVENFFDVNRVAWMRLDREQPRRDLRTLAGDVVKVYADQSIHHQVALEAPSDPVSVRFEKGRLSQALHTLIANALELTPSGGVVEVRVTTETQGCRQQAVVEVHNPGGELSDEALHKLFDPLTPLHKVAGARYLAPGTAVALAVARRIIDAHGGRLDAESKPGSGVTFRVSLPIAEEIGLGTRVESEARAEGVDGQHDFRS